MCMYLICLEIPKNNPLQSRRAMNILKNYYDYNKSKSQVKKQQMHWQNEFLFSETI